MTYSRTLGNVGDSIRYWYPSPLPPEYKIENPYKPIYQKKMRDDRLDDLKQLVRALESLAPELSSSVDVKIATAEATIPLLQKLNELAMDLIIKAEEDITQYKGGETEE